MTEPSKFTFYVFRYIDNIVSGEFVNLAICLVEDSDRPDRFIGFEVMQDWDRLKSFFPRADVGNLKSWCHNLSNDLRQTKQSSDLIRTLENSSVNIEVFVESQAVLSHKQPETELRLLADTYLQ